MWISASARGTGPAALRWLVPFLLTLAATALATRAHAQQPSDTTRAKVRSVAPPVRVLTPVAPTAPVTPRVPPRLELTPAQRSRLDRLSDAQRARMREFAAELSLDRFDPAVRSRWQGLVRDAMRESSSVDVQALVQYTLRESYLEADRALRSYAERVAFFNETKKRLREEIQRARRDSVDSAAYVGGLEALLRSVGEDASLASSDLQNALQRRQQAFQTMSNLSKALHDAAMSMIRNMEG